MLIIKLKIKCVSKIVLQSLYYDSLHGMHLLCTSMQLPGVRFRSLSALRICLHSQVLAQLSQKLFKKIEERKRGDSQISQHLSDWSQI